ncbi:MAG: hypothetical protein ACYCOU_21970 [Sulfobacillus sp.]
MDFLQNNAAAISLIVVGVTGLGVLFSRWISNSFYGQLGLNGGDIASVEQTVVLDVLIVAILVGFIFFLLAFGGQSVVRWATKRFPEQTYSASMAIMTGVPLAFAFIVHPRKRKADRLSMDGIGRVIRGGETISDAIHSMQRRACTFYGCVVAAFGLSMTPLGNHAARGISLFAIVESGVVFVVGLASLRYMKVFYPDTTTWYMRVVADLQRHDTGEKTSKEIRDTARIQVFIRYLLPTLATVGAVLLVVLTSVVAAGNEGRSVANGYTEVGSTNPLYEIPIIRDIATIPYRAELVSVEWKGGSGLPPSSPFRSGECVYFLGSKDGTTYLFTPAHKTFLRVDDASIILSKWEMSGKECVHEWKAEGLKSA